ncbi:hypothetical protein [Merismopedia glauca]
MVSLIYYVLTFVHLCYTEQHSHPQPVTETDSLPNFSPTATR